MDATQILLISVISVLGLLLVILGIQVFFILKELKNTLTHANKVLEDAGVISSSISKPVESLSTIISGGKILSIIASFLASHKRKHTRKEDEE